MIGLIGLPGGRKNSHLVINLRMRMVFVLICGGQGVIISVAGIVMNMIVIPGVVWQRRERSKYDNRQ